MTIIIHEACQKYWASETHLAVDECMILYLEHTWHTIKAPHKSIKQDYKIWALEDLDYIFNWLWHSRSLSTEDLSKQFCQKIMTDTQTLIMSLAKSLSESAQDFILYLDNLFINLSLATALGQLDIEIMRSVWVNVLNLFEEIIQLKYVKKSLK